MVSECQGTTKAGNPCTKKVEADYCKWHRGQAPEADPADDLTPEELQFVEAYLRLGFNASRAAREVWPDIARSSSYEKGSRYKNKPAVKAKIDQLFEDYAMSASETVARISEHGRADVGIFLDDEGYLDLTTAEAQANLHLIKEIKRDKMGRPEIKFHSPQPALRDMAKIHGLVSDRVEVDGKIDHHHTHQYDYSVLTDDELDTLERLVGKLEATVEED